MNALILKVSVPLAVLAVTVTDLVTWFCPAPLNFTNISPLSPGAMGVFLGYCGTVQPQLLVALVMINGPSPVFVNLKMVSWGAPCSMVPKSCSFLSKVITGTLLWATSLDMALSTLSATILSEAFSLQETPTRAKAMAKAKIVVFLFMVLDCFYKNNQILNILTQTGGSWYADPIILL